ncbi:MAG: hypothetical protein M3P38_00520 [Chloroflexota bacterium]|nr:hypothetical protein [Chloroflexota bacterium]
MTVHFPWGSLFRGALAEDEGVFQAICRLPRPSGALTLLFSVIAAMDARPSPPTKSRG